MSKLVIDNSVRKFDVAKTTEHKVLNFADIQKNHNKFYEAKLEQTATGEFRITTHYGRVGEDGKLDYRYFEVNPTEEQANNEYYKLLNAKVKKGYREIKVEIEAAEESTLSDSGPLSELDKLILQLYDEAVTIVKKQVQTPLGKLTQEQIDVTKGILDRLYDAIEKKLSQQDLENLSSELYTNLPQVSESRTVSLPIISTFDKLQKQIELLDIISSLVAVQGALNGNAKTKYEATKACIELLPQEDPEWERIEKYIVKSQSKHHGVNIHVNQIFKVGVHGEDERFNPRNLETKELFHGTRTANILNILTSGLMIKPKTAIHTGSMFGNGIYFADQSTKSTQYAHRWAGNKNNNAYLFLCDIAVGNIRNFEDAQPNLNTAPTGYDSVKGVEGRSLAHNEYIIYEINQCKIKYLIDFEVKTK